MIVRKATRHDAPTISTLTSRLFVELGHPRPLADFDEFVALCTDLLEKGPYVVFLAEGSDGSADGILTMSESAAIYAGGRFGIIREFYVVPEMRSQGIGKALWGEAKEFAHNRGWKRIEVTPPPKNEHLRVYNFYTGEGFREIGPRLKFEEVLPVFTS
jgi:GNAT superfamily N-acetyltransferase